MCIYNKIASLAARSGWRMTVTPGDSGTLYLDFIKDSLSGRPFAFSAMMDSGSLDSLSEDLDCTLACFDFHRQAKEWSEAVSNDVDDIIRDNLDLVLLERDIHALAAGVRCLNRMNNYFCTDMLN